jgi:hypothetical protein
MTVPDLVNGSFEFIGSIFLWMNVYRLHADKMLRGYDWKSTAFFSAWGFWNLYYYPSLDQYLSFAGGCSIVLANTVWLVQMYYYRKN